jgi:hypothetical protein
MIRTATSCLAAATLIAAWLAPIHHAEARKANPGLAGVATGVTRMPAPVTRDHRGQERPVQRGHYSGCRKLISHTHGTCPFRDHRK